MDKQEIELIKNIAIHACYKVCVTNGYASEVFEKLKREQERVFENYISNKNVRSLKN